MEMLDFIKGRLFLQTTILRMRLSRENIESKHPDRTDLIEPLNTSENDLILVVDILNNCEHEIRTRGRQLNNYERLILEQKARIKELENELKFLNIEL